MAHPTTARLNKSLTGSSKQALRVIEPKVNDWDSVDDNDLDTKYYVTKILGEGTYGKVLLCIKVQTSQENRIENRKECVLKQMKKFGDDEKGVQPTTLREVSILGKLQDHKRIVNILDQFVSTENVFYAEFEKCEMDLANFMCRYFHPKSQPMPLELIKRLSYQLLDGVAYMHTWQILHKELKPQNILITINNTQKRLSASTRYEDINIKIADSGLAKGLQLDQKQQKLNTKVVTSWYRAPELMLDLNQYDERVDTWSVGCIIAEMARSGVPIFDSWCKVGTLMKVFAILGRPDEITWPDCAKLKHFNLIFLKFKKKDLSRYLPVFSQNKEYQGINVVEQLLTCNPKQRASAKALLSEHSWFEEERRTRVTHTAQVQQKEKKTVDEIGRKYKMAKMEAAKKEKREKREKEAKQAQAAQAAAKAVKEVKDAMEAKRKKRMERLRKMQRESDLAMDGVKQTNAENARLAAQSKTAKYDSYQIRFGIVPYDDKQRHAKLLKSKISKEEHVKSTNKAKGRFEKDATPFYHQKVGPNGSIGGMKKIIGKPGKRAIASDASRTRASFANGGSGRYSGKRQRREFEEDDDDKFGMYGNGCDRNVSDGGKSSFGIEKRCGYDNENMENTENMEDEEDENICPPPAKRRKISNRGKSLKHCGNM